MSKLFASLWHFLSISTIAELTCCSFFIQMMLTKPSYMGRELTKKVFET